MYKNALSVLMLTMIVLLCVGCDDDIGRTAETAARDPSKILPAYAYVAWTVTFLLVFFGDKSLWEALLNGLRYTSLAVAIIAPFYALMQDARLNSLRIVFAMEASGLIGVALTSFLLWEYGRKNAPTPKKTDEEPPSPTTETKKKKE
jgi:hypothetical protein